MPLSPTIEDPELIVERLRRFPVPHALHTTLLLNTTIARTNVVLSSLSTTLLLPVPVLLLIVCAILASARPHLLISVVSRDHCNTAVGVVCRVPLIRVDGCECLVVVGVPHGTGPCAHATMGWC